MKKMPQTLDFTGETGSFPKDRACLLVLLNNLLFYHSFYEKANKIF